MLALILHRNVVSYNIAVFQASRFIGHL